MGDNEKESDRESQKDMGGVLMLLDECLHFFICIAQFPLIQIMKTTELEKMSGKQQTLSKFPHVCREKVFKNVFFPSSPQVSAQFRCDDLI